MSDTGNDQEKPKRNPRGLFERPKGSGVWWVVYFDQHGRRHREKVGPRGLALDVYRKRKNEIREGRFFPEQIRRRDVLLADAIDEYLARKKSKLRAYGDWERIGECWKKAPETKAKTLRQVASRDVEHYRERRRAEGAAEGTCNRHLTLLRAVYNLAIADGKAEANPVVSGLFFKETNQRVRYLSDDEETRLREKMGDEEWPKVAFALATGFRQGNQFRLTWADVNFDAGTIRARRSKSGHDYHVPMNDELRAMLRGLPSRLRSPYVFPSETGETPLDAKNFIHRVFAPALERASIEGFRWHDLRHTFASRLVMAVVDLRTVQELMGHQTIAMTLRYSHLSPAHKFDAVQRLASRRTATTTATTAEAATVAQPAGGQVVELPTENDGRCWDRTSDPRLVRPFEGDDEPEGGR